MHRGNQIAPPRRVLLGIAAASPLAMVRSARAQATQLRVMIFPGTANLPLLAAQHIGAFERRGLSVELLNTPNSTELRQGLAQGRHQIVHGGVDNAVSQAEAGVDIGVFIGGDSAFNWLVVKPEITTWADLRGRTLIVDAPDTAFALVAYRMLAMNGLPRGSYEVRQTGAAWQRFELMLNDPTAHASMLAPPFNFQAVDRGMRKLADSVQMIGPYLGNAGWALRGWMRDNPEVMTRYVQAYIEGLRWVLAPANADAAAGLLAARLRLDAAAARRGVAIFADPVSGAAPDGRFDMEGFRAVLRLRAETLGAWGGTPPAPERFLELGVWDRAMAGL